jgi:hypothetical protein
MPPPRLSRADVPITYEQWLQNRIAQPLAMCGPDVIDSRPWYQHLPGLNPYAGLEAQAREDARQAGRESQAEAEAG